MLRAILAGVAMVALCGPGWAQHWIPPAPGPNGIDTCSGWDTVAAQQKCVDDEAAARRKAGEAKQAADAQWRAIREAADAKVRAEKTEAARLRAARDEADRKQAAVAAEAAEEQKDEAQRQQIQRETEAAIAAEKVREAEEVRAAAAQEAVAKRQKLIAKMKAEAEANAQAAARAEAADPFKRVDALDLQVSPEDFLTKPVKLVSVQCYAPSPGGRRCFDGDGLVLLQLGDVGPAEVLPGLDHSCGSLRVAINDVACRWTARFVLDEFRVEKTGDGQRKTILLPKSVELSR